jgi:hypothetical protein
MPAALAVVRHQHTNQPGDVSLLSLVVAPQLRGLGLARGLLNWLRSELQERGWARLNVSYPLDHSCNAAMEKLTSSREGWTHRPGLQLMQLDRNGAGKLIQRLAPLVEHAQRSHRYSLVTWNDLPATTRNGLGESLRAPVWAHPRNDGGQDPLPIL